MKRALITGIAGQDGSYLAELLLKKGYEVWGITRRISVDREQRFERLDKVLPHIKLLSASVDNYASIFNAINEAKPFECYHLAAQSFVMDSFMDEFTTMEDNVRGTHNVLSILKRHHPDCRMYFAASSEMFGDVLEVPQTEKTPFNPRSIYGVSKCAGFYMTKHYRDTYHLHASSGILFNHEGPRRGSEFVTRKIARYAARISRGLETSLPIGNLTAQRDWGHAKDYVRAMWLMLQQDKPDDYVVATGNTWSVHDFCRKAFRVVGLNCDDYLVTDQRYIRPSEVNLLVGDYSKAKKKLGWAPTVTFDQLVNEMVQAELEIIERTNYESKTGR